MGFADLFRPRWQHSDPVVRRTAVSRLKKQHRLAEIAREDSDPGVRRAAVYRLTDQEVLAACARNEPDIMVGKVAALSPSTYGRCEADSEDTDERRRRSGCAGPHRGA